MGLLSSEGDKQSIYEQERDRLTTLGQPDPKTFTAVTSRIERYDKEKKEITIEAKKIEAKRDEARSAATLANDHAREMGLAISVFQIAIALGGVTLVMKKRWMWNVSIGAGAIATVQMFKVLLLQ